MSVVRIIDEQIVPGKRLGRHVAHDPRSLFYKAALSTGPLRAVKHRRHAPPFDQGALGSCTGNAVAGAVDSDPIWRPRHGLREPGAVRIYELATTLDWIPGSYPPDDTGSSGLAACQAAVKLGYLTGYKHAFGIDQALAALQLNPVITGLDWYEGFDSPDANGVVQISGQVRGGHEFEVVEYRPDPVDPGASLVGCWNSWGTGWGQAGKFYMAARTWGTLLDAQGDVTVPVRV